MRRSFNSNNISENEIEELCRSARDGKHFVVERLLMLHGNKIVDVCAQDNIITPLMYAAKGGHGKTIDLLLQYGADIDRQDASGATALVYAVCSEQKEAVELLLTRGANAEIQTENHQTALNIAEIRSYHAVAKVIAAWQNLNEASRNEKLVKLPRLLSEKEIYKKRRELLRNNESKNPFKK